MSWIASTLLRSEPLKPIFISGPGVGHLVCEVHVG